MISVFDLRIPPRVEGESESEELLAHSLDKGLGAMTSLPCLGLVTGRLKLCILGAGEDGSGIRVGSVSKNVVLMAGAEAGGCLT